METVQFSDSNKPNVVGSYWVKYKHLIVHKTSVICITWRGYEYIYVEV